MRVLGVRQASAPVPEVDRQGTLDDLPAFLGLADFVVLAVPSTPETRELIGRMIDNGLFVLEEDIEIIARYLNDTYVNQ